jgi:hypothetical protein
MSNKVKDLGAVFTPIPLINTMLDALPSQVWSDKSLSWLEPSCGNGNFIIELQKRGVVDIDAFEIDAEFSAQCRARTGIDAITDDFIESPISKLYDVIIGNPPYQRANKKNGTARGGKCQLYLDFVDKCLSLLKDNGYLLFIHPCNWRKVGSSRLPSFLKYNLLTVSLYNRKLFDSVNVNVDWYVLQKTPYNGTTRIYNNPSESDLTTLQMDIPDSVNVCLSDSLPFIPNFMTPHIQDDIFDIIKSRMCLECKISCELHAYTKKEYLRKTKDCEFIHPIYNTSAQNCLWSRIPHSMQFRRKVIMSTSGKLSPFYDDGKLGTTQNSMYILVDTKEDADEIINRLQSESFIRMLYMCNWGLFRTEQKLITMIL